MGYLQPGDLVDRFRIIKRLDSGGMGDVYLALDTGRFVNVALKVLHHDSERYEKLRRRFLLEADVYRRMSHPNIVGVVAAGQADDIDYIALEHIRGTSLADYLSERGVLPLDLAESVLQDLAYAVNAAHQADIIHRDIKPRNIMLTADNVSKLIDFGVAKATATSPGISGDTADTCDDLAQSGSSTGISSGGGSTGSAHVVGTLAYCSPEQLQCQEVDARSDIYSLGLVFYEIFTGLRPVAGHTAADILLNQSKLDQKIVPPSQIEPRIHPALESMILKMIRYDPAERFQSSIELIEQIHGLDLHHRASTRDSVLAKSKTLATLELADTYYWKAQSLLDAGRYAEALREFDKLLHTSQGLAPRLSETMIRQIDHLFRTRRSLVVALDDDFPPGYAPLPLSFLTYLELLGGFISLYRHLSRPRSSILALVVLERRLAELADGDRPDVARLAAPLVDRLQGSDDVRATADSLDSLREGGVAEDLALERALAQIGTGVGHAPERAELLLDRAILLAALHEDRKAFACARDVLALDDKNPDAANLAVALLVERGLVIHRDTEPSHFWLELYELLGLVESAGVELKRDLHGDISDLAVYQKIVDLHLRSGHERELWPIYFQMATILLEADYPERCGDLLRKSLELAPGNEQLVGMVKSLKNVHKIFTIQELSRLGTSAPS